MINADLLFVLTVRYWLKVCKRNSHRRANVSHLQNEDNKEPLTESVIHGLSLHYVLSQENYNVRAVSMNESPKIEYIHKGACWQAICMSMFEALFLTGCYEAIAGLKIHEWYNGPLFQFIMQRLHEDLTIPHVSSESANRAKALYNLIMEGLTTESAESNQK